MQRWFKVNIWYLQFLNSWWRTILQVEVVAWKKNFYSLVFTLMNLRMPDVIQDCFEVCLLIFRLGVENGNILLYRNFVFRRSNLKDKTMYILYSFRHLSQSILLNSSKKHFLLNFWIFGISFLLLFRETSVWLLINKYRVKWSEIAVTIFPTEIVFAKITIKYIIN